MNDKVQGVETSATASSKKMRAGSALSLGPQCLSGGPVNKTLLVTNKPREIIQYLLLLLKAKVMCLERPEDWLTL